MHYDDELFDEEKEISIDELVEALSGEDEDGDPKSVVECSLYKVETTEDGTLEKINEMTSFTAAPGVFVNRISFTGPLSWWSLISSMNRICGLEGSWKSLMSSIHMQTRGICCSPLRSQISNAQWIIT